MTSSLARGVVGAAILAGLVIATPAAQQRRVITEHDLLKFTWIADPQISPDGTRVAFVRVAVNAGEDRYETSLWMVETDGGGTPRSLTTGPRDAAPRWSPDGRSLAFLRSTQENGEPKPPQIHLMRMDGGEARQITNLAKGVSDVAWSPDGRSLAFASTTAPGNSAKQEEGKKSSDVRVITRAVYRWNGGGYVDPTHPSHLWTIAVPANGEKAPDARQITSGPYEEQAPVWSPDGARLCFTSTRVDEPYYAPPDADLYAVPAAGGDVVRVGDIDGTIGGFAWSPDGRQLAFEGSLNGRPVRSSDQTDLFVMSAAEGSQPRNLTGAYDFDVAGGLGGDQRAPRGSLPSSPIWTGDGRSIVTITTEHGSANLVRVDAATGRVEPLTKGAQDAIAFTASADASRLVALIATPTNIGDLFLLDMSSAGAPLRRLTDVNAPLFAQIRQSDPEEIWYSSFDGRRIQGWILKPPDFDPSKKYPLILEIHGGPHAAYGATFMHEFSWMAAKGYVVLYTNPRGSTSYGQEFANIIQFHYPGDDYKDLMAGVDEVIKRGYIDEKRLGVTGGSGGGVLTNWTITQTDRFAAAVSQRSIADWAGFWYTADFSQFQPSWFKGAPWEDPADYAERSAITHIARVTTPLMLIEGEADLRTPPADGGEMMFRALKYLKKPVVMVRFPDESHELSRSGKPSHRVERLQHIVGWFDKYLQGKSDRKYDTN